MAVTTTWTNLQTYMAAELKRSDLTTYFPNFINNAEFRISRELKPRGFEKYITGAMTSGNKYFQPPVRLLSLISLHILVDSAAVPTTTGTQRLNLPRRSYSWLLDYAPSGNSSTGVPRYYSDVDGTDFIVGPSPNAAYTMEMAYYEKLAPLDASNETNWLTVNAPDLLLYAALLESAPFLRDDPRVATWQGMYDRLGASLTAQDAAFMTDAATQRSGGYP